MFMRFRKRPRSHKKRRIKYINVCVGQALIRPGLWRTMGQQVGPIPIPNPNPIQDQNQRSLSLKDGVRSRGKSFITKSPSGHHPYNRSPFKIPFPHRLPRTALPRFKCLWANCRGIAHYYITLIALTHAPNGVQPWARIIRVLSRAGLKAQSGD